MKRTLLFLALAVGSCAALHSQSVSPHVITSSGAFYSNASGSISWTMGEPMGETYASTNNKLTQGFQQPWDFSTGFHNPSAPVNAEVFPNPTAGAVQLQFDNASTGQYMIEVYNALGQQMSATQFTATPSSRATVSLAEFANGIYFITVRKIDGTESSTFKVTKNE